MKRLAIILFLTSIPLAVRPESAQPLEQDGGPLAPRPPISLEAPGDSGAASGTNEAPAEPAPASEPAAEAPLAEPTVAPSDDQFTAPTRDETGRSQVACDDAYCSTLALGADTADRLDELMSKEAGQILVTAGDDGVALEYEALQPLRGYLRGVADRDGRVSVEPVYVRERAASPLFVKDVISVSWSIISWMREKIVYRHTKHYHGKVVYHPVTGKILLVNFVHRRYGDICSTLISRCDVVEYLDEKTFDLTLARRLEESRKTGRPVQVIFRATPAFLPKNEISADNLKAMNSSTRIYKWMVAAEETEKKPLVRQRFIITPAAVAAVDISIMAYKIIRDLIMYRAARDARAEVVYTGAEAGGRIESVIFTRPAKK